MKNERIIKWNPFLRLTIILAIFLLLLSVICGQVIAQSKPQTFPTRTITIIVPFNVGGATDTYVRTLAKAMEGIIDTTIDIVNILGGRSIPAFNYVQSQPADGHTILAIGSGDLINTVLGRYDYRKITPLASCQWDQGVFWVPVDSPFKDLKEVLEDAKANPGKQKWTGGLTFDEILVALFTSKAGVDIKYDPYKSCTEANVALAGGFYTMGYEEIGPMLGLYEAGKIRPVVVLTEERLPKYPDIPTVLEYGIDVTLGRWRGLGVKIGTSAEIVTYLENVIEQALESKEYKGLAARTVTDQRPGFMPSTAIKKQMDEEFLLYKRIMEELGLVK